LPLSRSLSFKPNRFQNYGTAVLCILLFQTQTLALADSAALPSETPTQVEAQNSQQGKDEQDFSWNKPLTDGPDTIFYFAEAVSGKTLKQETKDLLRGVDLVTIDEDKISLHRIDNELVELAKESEHGRKFFDDWEKSKVNIESKFGPAGKAFLDSIARVQIDGTRIKIQRSSDDEFTLEMGDRKLHHAFDLRGLRFGQLSMSVETNNEHPWLKDIQGVSAVINAPGFSFPVGVREFSKVRMEKENDIRVGVANPMPGPVRALLFLPSILRFHFKLPRKEQK
jgi:hypothetical protein